MMRCLANDMKAFEELSRLLHSCDNVEPERVPGILTAVSYGKLRFIPFINESSSFDSPVDGSPVSYYDIHTGNITGNNMVPRDVLKGFASWYDEHAKEMSGASLFAVKWNDVPYNAPNASAHWVSNTGMLEATYNESSSLSSYCARAHEERMEEYRRTCSE